MDIMGAGTVGDSSAQPIDGAVGAVDEDTADEESFEDRVVQSIYDMFWAPEIERRGGIDAIGGSLQAALAILPANGSVKVQLNQEVQLVARSTGTGDVTPGDMLTLDNLEFLAAIEPAGIDPDVGWALLATLPDGQVIVAFDYRRNRGRALGLLERAEEFLAAASESLDAGRVAAAIEALHAAAELAVTSMMVLGDTRVERRRNSHSHRMSWLNHFTRYGNAPRDFHAALKQLNEWRPTARYYESTQGGSGLPEPHVVEPLREAVAAMVSHAQRRIGDDRGY